MTTINYDLPTIDINKIKEQYDLLPDDYIDVIRDIVYDPVDGVGVIRGTRPKTSGNASWVWRSLMSRISKESKFQCISPSLETYLSECYPDDTQEDRAYRMDMLELIVEILVETIPEEDRHGTIAWEKAFG